MFQQTERVCSLYHESKKRKTVVGMFLISSMSKRNGAWRASAADCTPYKKSRSEKQYTYPPTHPTLIVRPLQWLNEMQGTSKFCKFPNLTTILADDLEESSLIVRPSFPLVYSYISLELIPTVFSSDSLYYCMGVKMD